MLGGIDRVEINLGDGDDQIQIIAADVPIVVNGDAGKDTFYDTDRTNVVLPVPRTFNGGPDDDLFVAGVDSGQPNDYHGDAGTDYMRYTWRSDSAVKRSQTITLDDVADDGENNEGDNVHSDIEYAFGSDQADTIKGTANADYLVGMGGADAIDGNGGDDRLFADDSTDTGQKICDADVVNGGEGADEITLGGNTTANGEAGDDVIRSFPVACPAPASNKVTGGEGQDTATFFDLPAPAAVVKGLKVSLDGVANDGVGGRDNFASDIEDMYASSGGMTLIGSDSANRLTGGAGDDVLDGRGGADVLVGGLGSDTADYSSRSEPLSLTLDGVANDGATAGAGEGDLIRDDVENVRGGSGDDHDHRRRPEERPGRRRRRRHDRRRRRGRRDRLQRRQGRHRHLRCRCRQGRPRRPGHHCRRLRDGWRSAHRPAHGSAHRAALGSAQLVPDRSDRPHGTDGADQPTGRDRPDGTVRLALDGVRAAPRQRAEGRPEGQGQEQRERQADGDAHRRVNDGAAAQAAWDEG